MRLSGREAVLRTAKSDEEKFKIVDSLVEDCTPDTYNTGAQALCSPESMHHIVVAAQE